MRRASLARKTAAGCWPANGRANGKCAKRAGQANGDAIAGTLAQADEPARRCVTLIIRRSWVRSPPAPHSLTWADAVAGPCGTHPGSRLGNSRGTLVLFTMHLRPCGPVPLTRPAAIAWLPPRLTWIRPLCAAPAASILPSRLLQQPAPPGRPRLGPPRCAAWSWPEPLPARSPGRLASPGKLCGACGAGWPTRHRRQPKHLRAQPEAADWHRWESRASTLGR